jgi:hypothetical protein
MVTIGLRFAGRDAPLLEALAAQVRRGEILGDVATYEQAALAARTGEPLVVHCTEPQEAYVMAAMYARIGVTHPAVEALGPAARIGSR